MKTLLKIVFAFFQSSSRLFQLDCLSNVGELSGGWSRVVSPHGRKCFKIIHSYKKGAIHEQILNSGLACVLSVLFKPLGEIRGGSRIFFRRGALVSCSTSTPINHIVFFFFLQNTSCIRKPQVISGGGVRTPCTLPLDPPLEMISRCEISSFPSTVFCVFGCIFHLGEVLDAEIQGS